MFAYPSTSSAYFPFQQAGYPYYPQVDSYSGDGDPYGQSYRTYRQAMLEEQRRREAMRRRALLENERRQEMKRRAVLEDERLRRIQASYNDHLAQQLFGGLFSPLTTSTTYHQPEQAQHTNTSNSDTILQSEEADESDSDDSDTTAIEPLFDELQAADATAIQPLSSEVERENNSHSKIQSTLLSYDEAVDVVLARAKRVISAKQGLRSIQNIRNQLVSMKEIFVEPESLVFNLEKSNSTNTPVLAFVKENRPLQAYEESLVRLLVELDGISLGGSRVLKAQRKETVLRVEAELKRLDEIKLAEWAKVKEGRSSSENSQEA